ncbi:hypothetical protein BD410DRAFT_272939 [Rickenella mellea]|uniref:Uncharacterized protein n=1 Tax=Rickenella mellea TaxID=50990 RepID=A0A4Y7Q4L7_9AGAM|nr:hypothetical protein BD410DRAFT_272939 [Rickenella mellea]
MALTATAQSALPRELSWDETIVPALRKRLESESQVLSKRMSTVSISGDEAYPVYTSKPSSKTRQRPAETPPPIVEQPRHKPSAIPRPSLQSTRKISEDSESSHYHHHNNEAKHAKHQPQRRARTYSSPYMFDANAAANGTTDSSQNASVLPTPTSSRSNSPMVVNNVPRPTDVMRTRIPKVARTRSDSASNHAHINGVAGSSHAAQNGYPITPETSPDPWPQSKDLSRSSHDSVAAQVLRGPPLMYEAPPFTASSFTTSFTDDIDNPHRPSLEEERPFEHWYRGEISRNGGVGELRVGNRMEMLEIANYGHTLRKATSKASPALSSAMLSGRRMSSGQRDSFYFDEEMKARAMQETVLDEMPLTDMEVDTETDRETTYHDAPTSPTTPSTVRQATSQRPNTNIPRYTAGPSSSSTAKPMKSALRQPKTPVRGASEPPEVSRPQQRANGQSSIPQSQSLTVASSQAQKRERERGRTKSPQPSPKKAKGPAPKRSKSAMDVRQAAEYPEPPDVPGGMADAIPSWTQPRQRTGNWDEVVLPVVARKMGLDDHYEEANGSPRQPQASRSEERIAAPAPGTFGFDHTKYRPPRTDQDGEDIPMDEFGSLPQGNTVEEEPQQDPRTERRTTLPPSRNPGLQIDTARPTRSRLSPPPSPAPFSHYLTSTKGPANEQSAEEAERIRRAQAAAQQARIVEKEESGGAGCCKCVIM